MRNINSKTKEEKKKNNIKILTIVTIIVVLFTISFAVFFYFNYDPNIKSLQENGYVLFEDGSYIKNYPEEGIDNDKWPYRISYTTISNDYSKIAVSSIWRYDSKETGYLNQLEDYEYSPLSNMANGTFYQSFKKNELGNFYHASYDFNNGTLICDASKTECNRYVQDFSKLKEEYYLVIKK